MAQLSHSGLDFIPLKPANNMGTFLEQFAAPPGDWTYRSGVFITGHVFPETLLEVEYPSRDLLGKILALHLGCPASIYFEPFLLCGICGNLLRTAFQRQKKFSYVPSGSPIHLGITTNGIVTNFVDRRLVRTHCISILAAKMFMSVYGRIGPNISRSYCTLASVY